MWLLSLFAAPSQWPWPKICSRPVSFGALPRPANLAGCWLHSRSQALDKKLVLALWGHPRISGSGSANLKFRFVHHVVGGGCCYRASADTGARAAEQAVMLVARDWTSSKPPANQCIKFVPARWASTGRLFLRFATQKPPFMQALCN